MSEKKCNLCYIRQIAQPMRSAKSLKNAKPYENGVTKPPMGWSSWNCFRNSIDEQKIDEIADALVQTGLRDVGFRSLNLDDNWHSSMRDANDELQGDFERFPSGMPALIKKWNEKGLKVGLYTSNGTLTCEDLPASFGREEKDAYTLAKWGAEFFKYDYCHHQPFTPKAPLVASIGIMKRGEPTERVTVSVKDATLGGRARLVPDEKLEAGAHVEGLDKNKGIIVFESVEAEAGEYILTITTRKIGDRKDKFLAVEVNEDDAFIVTVPGCAKFNFYARVQCKVRLKDGGNVIKLYNPFLNKGDGYMFQYQYMGKMLKQATERVATETLTNEKPITYSICEWGVNRPWHWGRTAGNQWRTTPDIRPWWWWMKLIYERTVRLYKYSDKGHYNDPDMLEVGNGKLTYDQNKSHFSVWCMLNAPLILGNDLRKFIKEDGSIDEENVVLKIVKNQKMIAVNQDEKSKQCKRVKFGLRYDVLVKELTDGYAVCLFNKSGSTVKANFDIKKIDGDEYLGFKKKETYRAEDLWSEETFDTNGVFTPTLPPYGCVVYKLS